MTMTTTMSRSTTQADTTTYAPPTFEIDRCPANPPFRYVFDREDFVDGFVHVDDVQLPVASIAREVGTLVATGELGLGTHLAGRDLAVVLVAEDEAGTVVAAGTVERGWAHGEFRARIPLGSISAGVYRLKAVLTDEACPSLTRLAFTKPFRLD